MFKQVMDRVWVFDCEWVPDPLAGRLLFPEVADESDDRKVMEAMWLHGGATQEEPRPFLKMATCRVVSIAAVLREKDPRGGGAKLSLLALPRDLSDKAATAERSRHHPRCDRHHPHPRDAPRSPPPHSRCSRIFLFQRQRLMFQA